MHMLSDSNSKLLFYLFLSLCCHGSVSTEMRKAVAAKTEGGRMVLNNILLIPNGEKYKKVELVA